MHSRFKELRKTDLGQGLESLLSSSKKYVEYAALSRAGLPAITAAVHELEDLFPVVKSDQAVRQFCGAVVGEVMRDAGHEILRPRGRVSGTLFTYGAVWTPFPVEKDVEQIIQSMSDVPRKLSAMLDGIPVRFLRIDPQKESMPVANRIVEMICNDVAFSSKIEGTSPNALGDTSIDALLLALRSDENVLKVDEFNARFEKSRETLCKSLVQCLAGTSVANASDNLTSDALRDAIRQAHDADQTVLSDLQEFVLELSFGS